MQIQNKISINFRIYLKVMGDLRAAQPQSAWGD